MIMPVIVKLQKGIELICDGERYVTAKCSAVHHNIEATRCPHIGVMPGTQRAAGDDDNDESQSGSGSDSDDDEDDGNDSGSGDNDGDKAEDHIKRHSGWVLRRDTTDRDTTLANKFHQDEQNKRIYKATLAQYSRRLRPNCSVQNRGDRRSKD